LCRWNLSPFHEAVDLLLWNRSISESESGVFTLAIPPPVSYTDDGFHLIGLDILAEVPTLELVLVLLQSVPVVNGLPPSQNVGMEYVAEKLFIVFMISITSGSVLLSVQ
jgi:hypothetical protein